MTTTIIDELEALAIDATGGRWTVERSSGSWRVVNAAGEIALDDGSAYNEYNEQCSEATRDYIVALHNGLPELLELAREGLRARELAWLEANGPAPTPFGMTDEELDAEEAQLDAELDAAVAQLSAELFAPFNRSES